MDIQPKRNNWIPPYYKKISNMPNENSLTLPNSRDEVIKFLKWWNVTNMHNASTADILSYEQLIYYELKYKEDKEIQNLIQILKEKIAKFYELKAKWLDNLIDGDIYKDLSHIRSQKAADAKLYSPLDRGEIQWDINL